MLELYRKMSILLEADRAIKYLRLGLAEVQKIMAENDFYDPIFIYLSSGIERLFKVMLCLNFIELNSRLPNPGDIWNHKTGHDLLFLKSKVESICIPLTLPFASMDYRIITTDKFINNICQILSEFGKRSRYFNLDAVLGIEQTYDSRYYWESMETSIGEELYGEEDFYKLPIAEAYHNSNQEITIRLEKFFRALARQFQFGNFSSQSTTYLFQLEDFTDLKDNQLGQTSYENFKNSERIRRNTLNK